MNPYAALMAALADALRSHAPIAGVVTHVFEAPPLRAARPFVLIDEPLLTDWGTKDQPGREARLTILLRDSGERRERARRLVGEIEAALAAMPRAIGDNWRIASLVPLRSRIVAEGDNRLTAIIEHRARMLREA
ncbi:tail completion protein gp17 [Sphingomonas sp. RS6]